MFARSLYAQQQHESSSSSSTAGVGVDSDVVEELESHAHSALLQPPSATLQLFRALAAACAGATVRADRHDQRAVMAFQHVPPEHVTAHDCVTAARLYQALGVSTTARSVFARALQKEPAAVEAALGMLECGDSVANVLALLNASPAVFDAAPFLAALVEAHAARLKHDYGDAHKRFADLAAWFPSSSHVQHHLGVVRVQDGYSHLALSTFQQLRSLDPYYVDGLDTYGSIVKLRGTVAALRSLAADLLAIDKQRPEPWCVAAMHAEAEGDRQKAMQLVERALAIDEMHTFAYLLRGALLLSHNLAKRAQMSFSRALSIAKDHSAYQGLVQAHLQLDDFARALAVAREASRVMPRSARALALVGLVLSCDQAQRRKARRVLEQALALRPRCIEAVLALADLDNAEGQLAEAVKRLNEQLLHDVGNAEFIHVKLGDVLAKTNPDEALAHYRSALDLNSLSEGANNGMVRLQNRTATGDEQRSGTLVPSRSPVSPSIM